MNRSRFFSLHAGDAYACHGPAESIAMLHEGCALQRVPRSQSLLSRRRAGRCAAGGLRHQCCPRGSMISPTVSPRVLLPGMATTADASATRGSTTLQHFLSIGFSPALRPPGKSSPSGHRRRRERGHASRAPLAITRDGDVRLRAKSPQTRRLALQACDRCPHCGGMRARGAGGRRLGGMPAKRPRPLGENRKPGERKPRGAARAELRGQPLPNARAGEAMR